MKTHPLQQEILLITGTSFSSRQVVEKMDSDDPSARSEEPPVTDEKEKLRQLCWNGLLNDLLPELFIRREGAPRYIYLWNILEGSSFLEIELGEYPEPKDGYYSIDPHLFLMKQSDN